MQKLNTREKILAKSLEMFNEKGIEYVGLRELAALLEIRVSNITYYFPTKDDLVNQISLELNELNSKIILDEGNFSMRGFLKMMEQIFKNQIKYRCLMLSIVHIMERNKVISTRHKETQRKRNDLLKRHFISLSEAGYLHIEDEEKAEYLASTVSLISRFWISEASISFRQFNVNKQIRYYLSLITHLILPYATLEGEKQIQEFFRSQKL